MSVRVCDWISVQIPEDTKGAINKYYFGDSLVLKNKTERQQNPIKEVMRIMQTLPPCVLNASDFIPCGSPILDNYAPTSTLQGCNRIARDGIITPGNMFVHHWFRSFKQPQRMRNFLRAPRVDEESGSESDEHRRRLANSIEVRLPLVEWILEKYGLRVVGPPKTTCSDFDCTWDRAKNSWTMKRGNTSYRSTIVSDCSSKNYPVHLRSVEYYAGSLAGDNEAFRKYSRNGGSISVQGIFDFIFSDVREIIYESLEPANEE